MCQVALHMFAAYYFQGVLTVSWRWLQEERNSFIYRATGFLDIRCHSECVVHQVRLPTQYQRGN